MQGARVQPLAGLPRSCMPIRAAKTSKKWKIGRNHAIVSEGLPQRTRGRSLQVGALTDRGLGAHGVPGTQVTLSPAHHAPRGGQLKPSPCVHGWVSGRGRAPPPTISTIVLTAPAHSLGIKTKHPHNELNIPSWQVRII